MCRPLLMFSVARTGLLAMHQLPRGVAMLEKTFFFLHGGGMGLLGPLDEGLMPKG